jgi:preprotein translocase subunit YajC
MEFIPLIIVGVVMYAVLILPQQRRAKEHRTLLASLEEGDEVVTNAGVYGFIAAVEGDVVWLEVTEGVELKLAKSSVASKIVVEDDAVEES